MRIQSNAGPLQYTGSAKPPAWQWTCTYPVSKDHRHRISLRPIVRPGNVACGRTPSQPEGMRDFQAYAFRAALTQRIQTMPAEPMAAREDVARRECAFLAAAGQIPAPGAWSRPARNVQGFCTFAAWSQAFLPSLSDVLSAAAVLAGPAAHTFRHDDLCRSLALQP